MWKDGEQKKVVVNIKLQWQLKTSWIFFRAICYTIIVDCHCSSPETQDQSPCLRSPLIASCLSLLSSYETHDDKGDEKCLQFHRWCFFIINRITCSSESTFPCLLDVLVHLWSSFMSCLPFDVYVSVYFFWVSYVSSYLLKVFKFILLVVEE